MIKLITKPIDDIETKCKLVLLEEVFVLGSESFDERKPYGLKEIQDAIDNLNEVINEYRV